MEEEIWKDIPKYEGSYKASTFGRIANVTPYCKNTVWLNKLNSSNRFKILKSHKTDSNHRYPSITLCVGGIPRRMLIHKVVAITFIPNPENKRCVNHIDGNTKNNNVNNLEWCTHTENMKHARETGLSKNFGEGSGTAKLTDAQVIEIRNINFNHISMSDVANNYGVTRKAISNIRYRKSWKHLM